MAHVFLFVTDKKFKWNERAILFSSLNKQIFILIQKITCNILKSNRKNKINEQKIFSFRQWFCIKKIKIRERKETLKFLKMFCEFLNRWLCVISYFKRFKKKCKGDLIRRVTFCLTPKRQATNQFLNFYINLQACL